jgi:hypothetical protein
MGDFDRFEKPNQANEPKKLVMVIALGAALLGLVGYQMVKRGPQQASAAESGDAPAAAVSETPAVLRESLAQDPTASLLRADGDVTPATKPMRNPFRMANAWLTTLHRPVQVNTQNPIETTKQPPRVIVDPINPVPLRVEDYKLSSIVNMGPSMAAIINGKVLQVGGVVGRARIVKISGQEVTLQNIDFPDLPATTLSMQPKLNQ